VVPSVRHANYTQIIIPIRPARRIDDATTVTLSVSQRTANLDINITKREFPSGPYIFLNIPCCSRSIKEVPMDSVRVFAVIRWGQ